MAKNSKIPNKAKGPELSVTLPDGRHQDLKEGEFRSLDGKLLFVCRDGQVEIRCPRTKAVYAIRWNPVDSSAFENAPCVPSSNGVPTAIFAG